MVIFLPGGSTGLACSAFGEAFPVICEAVCVAGDKRGKLEKWKV